jgi:HlyD family secretion protein
MKTKIVIGSILMGIVAILWGYFFSKAKSPVPRYKTVQVERGDIKAVISATGTLKPLTTVLVGSQVSGRIQALYADFNSQVKKGQVIAQIDPAPFQAQVIQSKAKLENARANLELAKVRVKDTLRTLRRYEALFVQKVISQNELDTALTNYEMAQAQLKSAEAQLGQARANLELAETNLHYTTIHSPVDGIIISREVDVGQTVAASFQTPVLFTIAQDLTKMQLEVNVDEADIGQVAIGQKGTFYVDAYPNQTFQGMVSQIRNNPRIIQNVVTYDVIMEVNNPDLKLKPGMTATVAIITAYKQNVLKVPNRVFRYQPAIQPKDGGNINTGTNEINKRLVWILDTKGQLRPISVVIGISDGISTEVKEGILQEGQEVVVGSLKESNSQKPPSRPGRIRFF